MKMHLVVSSWLTGPVSQSYLYNPGDSSEVTTRLLPTPLLNLGKTHGKKLLGKNSSTVPELQRSVKKLRC